MRIWEIAVVLGLCVLMQATERAYVSSATEKEISIPFEDETCCINHASVTRRPWDESALREAASLPPPTEGWCAFIWNSDGKYQGVGNADGDKVSPLQAEGTRRYPPRLKFGLLNIACSVGMFKNDPGFAIFCAGNSAYSCGNEGVECRVRTWEVAQKVVHFFPSYKDFPETSPEPILACACEGYVSSPPGKDDLLEGSSCINRFNCQLIVGPKTATAR